MEKSELEIIVAALLAAGIAASCANNDAEKAVKDFRATLKEVRKAPDLLT